MYSQMFMCINPIYHCTVSSQNDLPPRQMLDSYDIAVIPLGSDPKLRNRYCTHIGGVRIGRLLEDMDMFAVHLVFKHILNPKQEKNDPSPFAIITALVDKIDIKRNITLDCDIRMLDHVTWVGSTAVSTEFEIWKPKNLGFQISNSVETAVCNLM